MRYWMLALLAAVAAAPSRAEAALSLGEPAFVRSADGLNEFAVNVGAFHPTSKFNYNGVNSGERFGNNGFLFALDYLHTAVGPLALGGEFGYANRGEYNVTQVPAAALNPLAASTIQTRVRGDSMLLMAIARLRQPGTGWRPYAVGGAGFHKTHMDLYATAPRFTEFTVVRDDVTGTALMMRVGMEHTSPQGGFIGVEAGYIWMNSQVYRHSADGAAAGFSDVTSAASGITFILRCGTRFGAGS